MTMESLSGYERWNGVRSCGCGLIAPIYPVNVPLKVGEYLTSSSSMADCVILPFMDRCVSVMAVRNQFLKPPRSGHGSSPHLRPAPQPGAAASTTLQTTNILIIFILWWHLHPKIISEWSVKICFELTWVQSAMLICADCKFLLLK